MKAKTPVRKPFQPRFKFLPNPVMHRAEELAIMPQIAESNAHFCEQTRMLARNNRADSIVKANVLQWQARNASRFSR